MVNSLLLNKSSNNDFAVAFNLLRERVRDRLVVPLESEGKSMIPLIKDGSEVLVRLSPQDELDRGDIIAFKRGNQLILHRCMKKIIAQDSTVRFITKGDSFFSFDSEEVLPEDILGKVIVLKRYGRSMNFKSNFWKINNSIIFWLSYLEVDMRKLIFYKGRIIKLEENIVLQPLIDAFLCAPLFMYSYAVLFLARFTASSIQSQR